jgi:probable rRNA maturation factor
MVIVQKPVAQLSEGALERFLSRAKRAAGLRGVVNVLLTSSVELQALNKRFRGKDHPTDVLSFPPLIQHAGFVGDVAISVDIAKENAERLGHAAADEIRVLVLHGVLHLAGYDHETDNGAMQAKEMLLRKKLRLPVGLIERVQGKAIASVKKNTNTSRSLPKDAGKRARATRTMERRSR